ncbi:phosphonate transport system ATP-binding protein [Sphaerotilus hippei]|uniref:Phosphonate transport system ATP-binding protein n=1 Tax=Sphaerotilus hippei TaxID=744406 RepID=A0A318H3C1_9BURK|nr:ATP-binding cassette domain-containing protein [Sphaerotilus hippei]PXW98055.1 phosphonate transport system ATP-binding protein [Sphaerotilus hippei]
MKLQLEAVSAAHPAARPGAAPALRAIDLTVQAGEAVAVIGPSGAGKTSLLQVMACALPPREGRLRLDGQDPWALPRAALQRLRGRLFLAPQVPPLPPRQRVVTAVLAGRLPAMGLWASLRSLVHPDDLPGAQAALESFGLADKLFDRVDRLSGGERQRVGLARTLVAPASLWLIDEPLSALDPTRAEQAIAALIDRARERGATLVASLHQVDVALSRFPRVVGLRDGVLAFDLPATQVSPEHLAQLYARHEHELLPGRPAAADVPPPRSPAPVGMLCR